jgi:hypothetical protein
LNRRHLRYTLIAIPLAAWLGVSQLEFLNKDVEEYTSVSTRSTLLIAGLFAILVNPFGWGFYGFYGALQSWGRYAIKIIQNQFDLNLDEVSIIIEELKEVSFKNTFVDFIVAYGWWFIALMLSVIREIKISDPRVKALLALCVANSITTSGHNSVLLFLVLSVAQLMYPGRSEIVLGSDLNPVNR